MLDAHYHTYSSYNLHSADGVVFVWTLDGRIPREIYENHTKRGDFYSSHIHAGKHVHLKHAITPKTWLRVVCRLGLNAAAVLRTLRARDGNSNEAEPAAPRPPAFAGGLSFSSSSSSAYDRGSTFSSRATHTAAGSFPLANKHGKIKQATLADSIPESATLLLLS